MNIYENSGRLTVTITMKMNGQSLLTCDIHPYISNTEIELSLEEKVWKEV